MRTSIKSQTPESISTVPKDSTSLLRRYGWDVLVVVAMGVLLYVGMAWQYFDPDSADYECYAVAFWSGVPAALKTLPSWQCDFLSPPSASTLIEQMRTYHLPAPLIHFVASQSPAQPLHEFEFPLPTIIVFSLPLLAPHGWYEVAFAFWMSLIAAGIYMLLRHFRSGWAALVYALYLVIGGWGTAEGFFDLVPAALTVIAIICGVRKRWTWAFAFLALATVFKLYPVVLIIPFLLTQQMESRERWSSWHRLVPLAAFAAVCGGVLAVSLFLSVESTLFMFNLYQQRAFQVESVAASVLWLLSFLGYSLHPVLSPSSLDVLSPLAPQTSLVDTALLGAGLVYIWWLQWRGKVDLVASCLLTLLIVIFTGKVFSPEYLIWIVPLAAYVGEKKLKWIVAWCLLGGLTTFIYPYLYALYMDTLLAKGAPSTPLFLSIIAIRNLILLCIIVSLLFHYSRKQPAYTGPKRYFLIKREMKHSNDY